MSFITDTQIEVTKSLSVLSSCTREEQLILRALSVIDQPITQTDFKSVLNKLSKSDVKDFKGLSLDKLFTTELREKLKSKGLLQQNPRLSASLYIVATLNRRSVEAGDFNDISHEVDRVADAKLPYYMRNEDTRNYPTLQLLYLADYGKCEERLAFDNNPQIISMADPKVLRRFCFYPFVQKEFIKLSDTLKYQALAGLLYDFRKALKDSGEIVALLQGLYEQGECSDNMRFLLAEQYLQSDHLALAESLLLDTDTSAYAYSLKGWLAFLQLQPKKAVDFYQKAQQAKNKIARRKKPYIGGMAGIFYCLALVQLGEEQRSCYSLLLKETAGALNEQKLFLDENDIYETLSNLACYLADEKEEFSAEYLRYSYRNNDYYYYVNVVVSLLAEHWLGKRPTVDNLIILANFLEKNANNRDPLVNTSAQLLLRYASSALKAEKQSELSRYQFPHLLDFVKPKERWVQALDKLLALAPEKDSQQQVPDVTAPNLRMIWLIDPTSRPYSIVPKEQKMGKRGAWTKGRPVALKRLYEDIDSFTYLTAEDKKICRSITPYQDYSSWGRFPKESFELSGYSALRACVDHPRLYCEYDLSKAIELIEVKPEIILNEGKRSFKIEISEFPESMSEERCCNLTMETRYRYKLINFDPQQLKVASILGQEGITAPRAAKEKVINSIKALAPFMNIQSEMAEVVGTDITQIAADMTLYININRLHEGLELECHFQPLGEEGPCVLPGIGKQMLFTEQDGQRMSVRRDLQQEKKLLNKLIKACPLFSYMSEHCLYLDELEDALTVLEQLDEIQQQKMLAIVLQWPEGESLKIKAKAEQSMMQISLAKKTDWFAIEGELQINDTEVLDLKNLLTLVQDTPGRFIPLGNDEFLTLTSEFKQQLSQLARSTQNGQFHSLAAPVIEDVTTGMKVKSNKAWQTQVKKIKDSYKIKPQLPNTLRASLRDYQLEGYDWASRLAYWGAGACLADDMGIGKTLQALTVILSRADKGPSLVLAPTSVCFNWQEEALRFAPSLNIKYFGFGSKSDRQKMLTEAGEFDLIICSYGLLQTQGEQLAAIHWQTVIADEAQAIKNPQAKRSKAAMKLKADFKMITTGTPIENNLTELWSLFQFINPGLLGSIDEFNQRFAKTIESNETENKQAVIESSSALRKLISPFILRRLKTDVLTELPSRTEINLYVELSSQEAAFYEALRQNALENLLASDAKAGQKRIQILSEIMKLRQTCCNPALVMPETQIGSAKLAAFDGLLNELREGGHKALVFSQFVGHLGLLRAHLDKKGISYQYLDGSTAAAKRKKAVNAFQNGESDLFLISLKAGGSGLNLTAADYVIHMDPWWNPAVEDQASDRAHRMGQTRPVTIYRLIAQNTIEDKIIALHQQKRDLANSLLEGSESSGNISLDDLMGLLKTE